MKVNVEGLGWLGFWLMFGMMYAADKIAEVLK